MTGHGRRHKRNDIIIKAEQMAVLVLAVLAWFSVNQESERNNMKYEKGKKEKGEGGEGRGQAPVSIY